VYWDVSCTSTVLCVETIRRKRVRAAGYRTNVRSDGYRFNMSTNLETRQKQRCTKFSRRSKTVIQDVNSAFSPDYSGPCKLLLNEARRTCNILSLAERQHELGKRFFKRIIKDKSNVLFYLLPAKRDVQLTTRLRRAGQYPTIHVGLIVIKTLLFYLD